MKKLLLGSESVARGLNEAGVKFISCCHSSKITENLAAYPEMHIEYAHNEISALDSALGKAKNGSRSFCELNITDLDITAELTNAISHTKIAAGMVISITDDPTTQFKHDSRTFALAANLPILEPADSAECRDFVKIAYGISEKFSIPVILRLTSRLSRTASLVVVSENIIGSDEFSVDDSKTLAEFAETTPLNLIEDNGTPIGVVTAGNCLNYAKETFERTASYLKLGLLNPLPKQLILDFAAKFETVIVLEEIAPVIENHCESLGLQVIGKNVLGIYGEYSEEVLREMLFGIEPDYCEIGAVLPERP